MRMPDLDARLEPILRLLHRHDLVRSLAQRQSPAKPELVDSLIERQYESELRRRLAALDSADIAHLLEMLPPQPRRAVWHQVAVERAGEVLWEAADTVAADLIEATPRDHLLRLCWHMDPDGLHQVQHLIPQDVLSELRNTLDPGKRAWLQTTARYAEGSVGELMSPDVVVVPETATIKTTLRAFRQLQEVPDQTDQLFVVDQDQRLIGALPLKTMLVSRPRTPIAELMQPDVQRFKADDDAQEAARAFERYDLVSAPVIDERGRILGRLTVDVMMDTIREEAEDDLLRRDGLSGDEDLFGPVWRSAQRRWLWLAVNLMTAFVASRVIGLFEHSIEQLVALATLMPIVASVAGNTGNQTVALFVRGLAMDQVNSGNIRYLSFKEAAVSSINGLVWGSAMGLVASLLYGNAALGLVMAAAMLINLILAAVVGIAVPAAMHRLGRDPAFGSSVLLTFTTDSMGFFIFLGLATVFLLP
jgi:magnesium transporter